MVEALLFCQILIVGWYLVLAFQRSRDVFRHIYWLLAGYLGVYFIPLWSGREWIKGRYGVSTLILVYGLPVLSLPFILIGYRFAVRRFMGTAVTTSQWIMRTEAMFQYGTLLCVIGVLGEFFIMGLAGGPAVYYSAARTTGAPELTTAYIYDLRWLWTPGLAIMIGALIKCRQLSYFLTAGFFCFLAFIYNLAVAQRSGVWIYSLFGLALFQVWRRKPPSLLLAAGAGGAAIALLGFVGMARNDFHLNSDFDSIRNLTAKPPSEIARDVLLLSIRDEDQSRNNSGTYVPSVDMQLYINYLWLFPDVVDYDYGAFYAQYLVAWIPRALWPDRPDFRLQKKQEVFAQLGTCHICSPSPTIIGMYWMHGGVLAVCALCAFTGAFFGVFDAYGRAGGFRSPLATAVYLSMIGTAAKTPITIGPLGELAFWAPFTILPLFGLVLLRIKGRRRGRKEAREVAVYASTDLVAPPPESK